MNAVTKTTKGRIKKAAKVDVYQLVTDRIVESLEAGVVPWHQPWKNVGGANGPRSLSSLKPYRGVNVWVLVATALAKGYGSQWWGTYRQISERRGQVRAGEKGTPVVFWKFIEKKDADGKVVERIPFLRHFTVFNADQADDVTVPATDEVVLAEHETIGVCETLADRYVAFGGPGLNYGGDRACYSPSLDQVRIPLLGQFETPELYYGTLFHEFVHSTGHSSRLNRTELVEMKVFGDEDYSREELVAEMGAAFVCGAAGIDVNVQHHAAYIDNWLAKFRGDSKMLVQAAGAAQRAADLIVGRVVDAPKPDAGDES